MQSLGLSKLGLTVLGGSPLYAIDAGSNSITSLFSFTANALESITTNYQLKIETLESISSQYATLFSLLSSVQITTSHSIVLDLLARVNAEQVVVNKFLEKASTTFSLTAQVLEKKTALFESNLNVLTSIITQYLLNINALGKISADFSTKLTLLSRVSSTFNTISALLQKRTVDYNAVFNVYERVNKSFVFRIDTLSANQVVSNYSLTIALREKLEHHFSKNITTLSKEISEYSISTTLLTRVSEQLVSVFDLNNKVSNNFTVSFESIGRTGSVYSLLFNCESDLIEKTPAHLVIDISNTLSFAADEPYMIYFDKTDNTFII